jgi:hypothetical protein
MSAGVLPREPPTTAAARRLREPDLSDRQIRRPVRHCLPELEVAAAVVAVGCDVAAALERARLVLLSCGGVWPRFFLSPGFALNRLPRLSMLALHSFPDIN